MIRNVLILFFLFFSLNARALNCKELFFLDSKASRLSKLSVEDLLYRQNLAISGVQFFVKFLRIPDNKELASFAKIKLKKSALEKIIGDKNIFWSEAFATHSQKLEDARTMLIMAYHDFIREMKKNGVTPRSATPEEFYAQLMKSYRFLENENRNGELQVKHLMRVLGERKRSVNEAQYPVLFEGMDGLRRAAQERFPNSFKGFRDQRYGKIYNEETINLIQNKYRGVLATSFMGGVPWEKGQFLALTQLAKAKELLILIKEVNGETDLIPKEILEHPQVRIVTQTLDLGNEMRIWGGMVIIPTNANSLAGLLNRQMARERGQAQIVFAPQRMMANVATEKNHIHGAHQVWATGSLNEPIYPYSNFRSSRVNTMASQRHINSALIIEKSDISSGPLRRGAPGRWHVRNVDFETAIRDRDYGQWTDGIVDTFTFFPADGSRARPIPAVAVIPGDYHVGFQDERMLKAMKSQILDASREAGAPVEFMRLHDYEDNDALSPWDRSTDKTKKYSSGQLDAQAEINAGRSNLNALMELEPQLKVILSDADNHNAWKIRTLNNVEALNDPINGPLVRKLREVHEQGQSVLEYLYRFQEKFDQAIPDESLRQAQLNRNVYSEFPDRIIVLKAGQSFEVGPVDRPTNVAPHGDKIDSGKRGGVSLEPHAKANDRVVVGHTHTTGILGYAFNPGMIVRLRSQAYALGGYNAQQNAVVVVYANGAMQLFIYDPLIGKFFANSMESTLPGKNFFTGKPFVVDDPNDRVNGKVTTLNNYEDKPVY
jgi:hypothetical protein